MVIMAIRNLLLRKLDPPDTFNEVAAMTLVLTGFQHVSRVGEMRGHSALLSALVERWRPETHTFHLPVGEVTVMLEDVSYILGLPINGEAFLVENCIVCFGREPGLQDHVLEKVNIAWVRRCRDTEPCDTQESIEQYVRAHIFCVLGTVVFLDKLTTLLNSKFLPLLRDFHQILSYTSLAHLYRLLCRASRYNCKEMDGPLMLLFFWAWERMPLLGPIPRDQLGDTLVGTTCKHVVTWESLDLEMATVVVLLPKVNSVNGTILHFVKLKHLVAPVESVDHNVSCTSKAFFNSLRYKF
ncbi:hypothetical protein Ahy_B10g104351 [Arachis hypogaea]|uniref:Aminotransferase-like plant mobile domain-containing protein n=1 Tax=Arachis hypogaea TaxID=3818 RepID=A0A444X599_ARAHY|nr:hypothetical protein Ahy_B10g104351 [Arachis hypogaea]